MKKIETNMNAMIVTTLMMENQNSISPNHFTPMRLMTSTIVRASSARAHCGSASEIGFQKMRNPAMAVESAMPQIA